MPWAGCVITCQQLTAVLAWAAVRLTPLPYWYRQSAVDRVSWNIETRKETTSGSFSKTGQSYCAAEAIFYCPTMNSHRPKSQVTSKEQALIPEKESRRTWPRCHVSLEKSSKNHKPLEKWAKPNLSPDVIPRPANFYGEYFPHICHVVKPDLPELSAVLTRHSGWQK